MKKIVTVEGMNCGHCAAKVEQALAGVAGVSAAKVDLGKKRAVVTTDTAVTDDALKSAVDAAGFRAVSVELKKGLFGF